MYIYKYIYIYILISRFFGGRGGGYTEAAGNPPRTQVSSVTKMLTGDGDPPATAWPKQIWLDPSDSFLFKHNP